MTKQSPPTPRIPVSTAVPVSFRHKTRNRPYRPTRAAPKPRQTPALALASRRALEPKASRRVRRRLAPTSRRPRQKPTTASGQAIRLGRGAPKTNVDHNRRPSVRSSGDGYLRRPVFRRSGACRRSSRQCPQQGFGSPANGKHSEPQLRGSVKALNCCNACRGGGIRTHDLFVPNEARYQAAPHPA
jgi:hypothetical protein